jgi:hypothetical protein
LHRARGDFPLHRDLAGHVRLAAVLPL